MARNDFKAVSLAERKGDNAASVSGYEIFSARFQLPRFAFGKLRKPVFQQQCAGVFRGVVGGVRVV